MPHNTEITELKELNPSTEIKCNCAIRDEVYNEDRYSIKKSRLRGLEPYVKKQLKITLCLSLGNLLCGYAVGWSAPIAPKLKDPLQTPLPHLVSDTEASWIVSSFIIGTIIGANVAAYVANAIGRKSCLIIVSGINLVGFSLVTTAGSLTPLHMGRALIGLGMGSVVLLNIIYIGEIASPNIRGALTVGTCISHVTGSLLVYSIGPYVSFAVVGYVSIGINCVHTLALLKIPESPVYLMMKGKPEDAKLTLHNLGRKTDIDKELQAMSEYINEVQLLPQPNEQQAKPTPTQRWRELISENKNRRAFLITTTLFCLQINGGAMAIIFFATTIFKNAQSSVDPNVGTIILGLTEVSAVMLTPLLIERRGRRLLLLISTGGCCLCMGILGAYFYLEITHYTLISSVRWLPLVLLMMCLFIFNTGLGIVPNTIAGEMYSPQLRTTGSSIAVTLSWTLGLVTGSSFSYIVASLGNHGVFWLYSAINGSGFLFTVFVVPETRGKTLAEILER